MVSITKFNLAQRCETRKFSLHEKWNFYSIRNYLGGSINLRIVALIITEGFTTSSLMLLYFAVYQTWRSKRWKAGTSSSSPFLMKNVTFLFDKKYLHDSVQRFESLLVIMHSPCKTPRIRFSGCFQFSRLVRWGCRYRKPPRMNFNGEENRASYFEAVPLPKSNENISRPWNRILVPGNKGQNRVETVGQPGWNRRSRNKWILPDRDSRPISRCKPINKLDWQRTNQVQGSK